MRRLLASLPIALLILMASIISLPVYGESIMPLNQLTYAYTEVIAVDVLTNTPVAADNVTQLPEGLKLTKGVPFIPVGEIKKGDQVPIKVKATNNSSMQINYTLTLTFNGRQAATPKQLSLEPEGSQDIVFLATAQDAGPIDVRVGDLQGILTVKESSIFDALPFYLWIFIGVIALVVILLIVLMVMKPKKRTGTQVDRSKKQVKSKGKMGSAESTVPGVGPMPRPGMQNMPEGLLFGSQGGQPGSPQDMSMQGMQQPLQSQQMGMQQPFQAQQPGGAPQFQPHAGMPIPQQPGGQPYQSQPGMPSQFQQPGIQPQFQQPGIQQQFHPPQVSGTTPTPPQQPGIMQPTRVPQYPQPASIPNISQSPQQPGMGMQPGMPSIGTSPQPAMPFGMQATPQMQPGIQQATPSGMPPQMTGAYQSTGMPKFAVSNLTITPNKVKVGEQVNISIIVSNNGAQQGKYSVVLRIGGVVENITDLTLPPGASQTASFTVIKDAPGDYYTDIDGLGGFFTVIPLNPPSFTVTNFSVGPERVKQGQPVTITASVINTGEVAGGHTLILRVKGIAESQKDIALAPGKTENVEFHVAKDTPGFYPVSLENWTGKFVVEMDWNG